MPYIIGTSIPEDKVLVQSMTSVLGIGISQAENLSKKAGFGSDCRGKHVNSTKGELVEKLAYNSNLLLGDDLRRFQANKIRHLCVMSTYRGSRHKKGLPVRGQRTHTNAKKRVIVKFNAN